MSRRNFYEIINETPLNLQTEYERIYILFYEGTDDYYAVEELVENAFEYLPNYLVGRTISLDDFNRTYGFSFSNTILKIGGTSFSAADEIISFCEYVWNFCVGIIEHAMFTLSEEEYNSIVHLQNIIIACMDDLEQMSLKRGNLYIFVAKDPAVISVAEILDKETAISILEYHHHGLKGNLAKKKAILKLMADDIEGDRQKLRNINKTLETQLFQLLNKFVRHNQSQTTYIGAMKHDEIEVCYDDLYQMWLLAKLEIDHYTNRKERIVDLIEKINN